jgi:hypothetical protein
MKPLRDPRPFLGSQHEEHAVHLQKFYLQQIMGAADQG